MEPPPFGEPTINGITAKDILAYILSYGNKNNKERRTYASALYYYTIFDANFLRDEVSNSFVKNLKI